MLDLALDKVSRLMLSFRQGDRRAADELVELFYPELRRLACAHMRREGSNHTWQPTVLVNEIYLELVRIKALKPPDGDYDERAAFFGLAAHLMRRLLAQHARPLQRKAERVEFQDGIDAGSAGIETLAGLEDSLARLESINPKLRTVVELKVFEGLTGEETAARMQCGSATVTRYWHFAKQWLQDELHL
jgi:RNA polymerase sigma factor (TIGR02999 family)